MKKNTKNYLFMTGIGAIAVILLLSRTVNKRIIAPNVKESAISNQALIPFVLINNDSLVQLISYFAGQSSSSYIIDSSNGRLFRLHLSRFGPTPTEFFCGNTALPKASGQGFKLMVSKKNEIEAEFEIQFINNKKYVNIPSDILCGLMRKHPNIR